MSAVRSTCAWGGSQGVPIKFKADAPKDFGKIEGKEP